MQRTIMAGMGLLVMAGLLLGVVLMRRPLRLNYTSPATGHAADLAAAPDSPLPAIESPTASPARATPEPFISTADGDVWQVLDPVNRLSFFLPMKWDAVTPEAGVESGVTEMADYDLRDGAPPPAGAVKAQIGVSLLAEGEGFDAWVAREREAARSAGKTLGENQPYTLGKFSGVAYTSQPAGSDGKAALSIYLLLETGRIVTISGGPADSPAFAQLLHSLESLLVDPSPLPPPPGYTYTIPGLTPIPLTPPPAPSATPIREPFVVRDPVNRFTLTLPPGWFAFTPHEGSYIGATDVVNYDLGAYDKRPPGGISAQISIGQLEEDRSFEDWLVERRKLETSLENGSVGDRLGEAQPYKLGAYSGVAYTIEEPGPGDADGDIIFTIYLLTETRRIVGIGVRPMDSPHFKEIRKILETLVVEP